MTPPPRSEDGTFGRLDDRVLETLQRLRGEVAFSGLRRILGAHPESLARSLRRLEREGLVLRAVGGYRALAGPGPGPVDPAGELRTVAEVELPPTTHPEALVERLSSRWFGSLRWVGVVARPGEPLLAWATRSGEGLVLLGTNGRRLRVLVPDRFLGEGSAETEDAAYELLFHAVEALRGLGGHPPALSSPRTLVRPPLPPSTDN